MNRVVINLSSSIIALLLFSSNHSFSQIVTKQRFLSDSSQALDRIDPVTSVNGTTTHTIPQSTIIVGIGITATNSSQTTVSSLTFNLLTGSVTTFKTIDHIPFLFRTSNF